MSGQKGKVRVMRDMVWFWSLEAMDGFKYKSEEMMTNPVVC